MKMCSVCTFLPKAQGTVRDSTQQQPEVTGNPLSSQKVRCRYCYREGSFGITVTCVDLRTFLSLGKDPPAQLRWRWVKGGEDAGDSLGWTVHCAGYLQGPREGIVWVETDAGFCVVSRGGPVR